MALTKRLMLLLVLVIAAGLGVLTGVKGDAVAQVVGQDFYLHCIGDPLSCNEEAIPTVTETTTETTTTTVPGPTTTVTQTVTVTQPTGPQPGDTIFIDNFNDAVDAGTPQADPNPASWFEGGRDSADDGAGDIDCYVPSPDDMCFDVNQTFVDSAGHLVMEAKKVAPYTDDRRTRQVYYRSGALNSFNWDDAPPFSNTKVALSAGQRLTVRAKCPTGAGLRCSVWLKGANRSSNLTEVDIQELMGLAAENSKQRCNVHEWLPDGPDYNASINLPFDATAAYHDYFVEYRSDRFVIGVDGLECRTLLFSNMSYNPATNGEKFGLLFWLHVCDPDPTREGEVSDCWTAANIAPSNTFTTKRYVIDYVKITQL